MYISKLTIDARLDELEQVKPVCNSDYYWKRKKQLEHALSLITTDKSSNNADEEFLHVI
jgi:hypothetical protein